MRLWDKARQLFKKPSIQQESTEFAEYPAFPDRDKYKKQLYLKMMPGKGRAVFCKKHIKAGSLIETSPLLVLPAQDYPAISHTQLTDYIFHFDKEKRLTALALGFGSLYNHALYPNATYDIDHANRLIRYYASELRPSSCTDRRAICCCPTECPDDANAVNIYNR